MYTIYDNRANYPHLFHVVCKKTKTEKMILLHVRYEESGKTKRLFECHAFIQNIRTRQDGDSAYSRHDPRTLFSYEKGRKPWEAKLYPKGEGGGGVVQKALSADDNRGEALKQALVYLYHTYDTVHQISLEEAPAVFHSVVRRTSPPIVKPIGPRAETVNAYIRRYGHGEFASVCSIGWHAPTLYKSEFQDVLVVEPERYTSADGIELWPFPIAAEAHTGLAFYVRREFIAKGTSRMLLYRPSVPTQPLQLFYATLVEGKSCLVPIDIERLPAFDDFQEKYYDMLPPGTLLACDPVILPMTGAGEEGKDKSLPLVLRNERREYLLDVLLRMSTKDAREAQYLYGMVSLSVWDILCLADKELTASFSYFERYGSILDLCQSIECGSICRDWAHVLHYAGIHAKPFDEGGLSGCYPCLVAPELYPVDRYSLDPMCDAISWAENNEWGGLMVISPNDPQEMYVRKDNHKEPYSDRALFVCLMNDGEWGGGRAQW